MEGTASLKPATWRDTIGTVAEFVKHHALAAKGALTVLVFVLSVVLVVVVASFLGVFGQLAAQLPNGGPAV